MMEAQTYRYVFGPVPSRRLGRSLGVDLLPAKTCTYDCIYCQVGLTNHLSAERREYVPMEEVLEEIVRKALSGVRPDYITMSGSGEPTLYARLGELIAAAKAQTGLPVAVITNGSLLWDPAVRADLAVADLVMPSLDAGTPEGFRAANRPHPSVDFERMVEGLVAFRKTYTGRIWLEVLLLGGITDTDEELDRLAWHIARIAPDRVQINTVVRPPAESSARPAARERLEAFARRIGPRAEIIAECAAPQAQQQGAVTEADVLDMLRRRPCSLGDVAQGLALAPARAAELLEQLLEREAVVTELRDGAVFYFPRR